MSLMMIDDLRDLFIPPVIGARDLKIILAPPRKPNYRRNKLGV